MPPADAGAPGDATQAVFAVLGDPVKHSLSPAMHNAALQALAQTRLGLKGWRYVKQHVKASDLPDVLPRLHAQGFRGLNLTLPHKVEALNCIEQVLPDAQAFGAVNTLIATERGYCGTNTDGPGFEAALQEAFEGCGLGGASLVLCGAGGAARAIAVQALRSGAREIVLLNRSPERLEALVGVLEPLAGPEQRVTAHSFEAFFTGAQVRALQAPPILVNATSLGLKASDPLPLDCALLPPGTRVFDTTYGCANAWQAAARAQGFAYTDGLGMLVHQGALSLEHWTGLHVPRHVMRAAVEQALEARTANAE